MNQRVLAVRGAVLALLVIALAALLARSSLVRLLPIAVGGVVWLWIVVALVVALLPALLARETPVGAAALVVVPVLAVSAYGASRLDWLRLLKDFGVVEGSPVEFPRLILSTIALVLLWSLHAGDLAMRLRERAIERGIDRSQADAAAQRSLLASARALGIAVAGAAGLLVVALVGIAIGNALPTERGAFVVPLLAAGLLVGAAIYLARGESAV